MPHAQLRNGTWETEASTVSPSIISHVACFMVTIVAVLEFHDRPAALVLLCEATHGAERAVDVIGDRCRCARP